MRESLLVTINDKLLLVMLWFNLHRFERICRYVARSALLLRNKKDHLQDRFSEFLIRDDLAVSIESSDPAENAYFISFIVKGGAHVRTNL